MKTKITVGSEQMAFVSGFFAVIGRPNVGKSSLVNALVGTKVAIVSKKPQTTRNRIMGIVNGHGYQLVLVDTPGLQKPRNRLGHYMQQSATAALAETDGVLVVLDGSTGLGRRDMQAVERAAQAGYRSLIVLNKSDIAARPTLDDMRAKLSLRDDIGLVFEVSALTGEGIPNLCGTMVRALPPGPAWFPDQAATDAPDTFLCCELIREKALYHLREEIPHGVGVAMERFGEREDGVVHVQALILCERDGHKGIIIGRGGSMLKRIASEARLEMEEFFGAKVFLEIFVKVQPGWRDNVRVLRELGYE